jgi:hypothetical protein
MASNTSKEPVGGAGTASLLPTIKHSEYIIDFKQFVPANVGQRIHIGNTRVNATVLEAGPVRWEMTASALSMLWNELQTVVSKDPELNELFHFLYPTYYVSETPIVALSEHNVFRNNPILLDALRMLMTDDLDIEARRAKLADISSFPDLDVRIARLLLFAYDLLNPRQVLKVKRDSGNILYCDVSINGRVTPLIEKKELVESVTLEQFVEIHSWIVNDLLALYISHPHKVQSICTHPFVGNTAFMNYIQRLMEHQYIVFLSMSTVTDSELIVYRGSPHFKQYAIRRRAFISTSNDKNAANEFAETDERAKKIIIPPGTRILDLSELNFLGEREIIIFPFTADSNLVIEPVAIAQTRGKRQTYRIRNPTDANRNLPRSRRQSQRRRRA